MKEKIIIANIIVDLYEIRASTLKPLQARQMEKVADVFQYQFFTSAIAKLYDKYNVKQEDIKEVIRERSFNPPLTTSYKSLI